MVNDLPIYKITIDPEYSEGEDLGIEQIAFTSNPAIKVRGLAFESVAKRFFSDSLKYRVTAPAMIPMDIYRRDDNLTSKQSSKFMSSSWKTYRIETSLI